MASPPFNLSTTVPADNDIASQFPAVDRGHLDVVNSWIKTDHNLSGGHKWAQFLQVNVADAGGATAGTPTAVANTTILFRDTDGLLKIKQPDGTVESLGGVPVGMVGFVSNTIPAGWLEANGQAVSRATYARLFTEIGTIYGAGDGSTTFNLPNVAGRYMTGFDGTGSGRNAIASLGTSSVGGAQSVIIAQGNLPSYNLTVVDPGHTHGYTDPTHLHTLNDPSHTHVVTDSGHAHGVTDPGHVHAITDPGHNHALSNIAQFVSNAGGGGGITVYAVGAGTTPVVANANTGISINSHTTGLTVNSGTTGITNNAANTGTTMSPHTVDITINSGTTGLTVSSAGSNAAMSVLPPTIVFRAVIKF